MNKAAVTRLVLDTSVWIHYLIRPGSAVRKIVEEWWLENRLTIVIAPELLWELEEVLARRYFQQVVPVEAAEALQAAISNRAEMIPALGEIPTFARDQKDDKFIAAAILGNADYLISLDRDILALGRLGTITMLTPVDFTNSPGAPKDPPSLPRNA